jgi:hypothetical protein
MDAEAQTLRHRMTLRTSTKTVTFARPFVLSGLEGVQPPGTYDVETSEELLQTSIPTYRNISTLIRLSTRADSAALNQAVDVNYAELSAALERDAKPELTALREEEAERQKAYWDSRE